MCIFHPHKLKTNKEMGSLEEEKLVQMVQDFIEAESLSPISSTSSIFLQPLNHKTKYFTLKEIFKSETVAEAEVLERVLRHIRSKRVGEKITSLKKWLVKRLKMDGYTASLCQTSWVTSLGCPAGDYEYLDIIMKDERLIVDTDFKSQFEVARPTQSYKELTDTLPSIYVGNEAKLLKIISLLCSAAKESLKDRGLHIPPWRTVSYMQSKWGSACHRDSSISVGTEIGKWAPPPIVKKPKKRRDLGGGSGLSSQFSNMSINCC